ncbi:MAG: phosphoenolpyruvate carboxykinase, partial [Candidatus Izemoplasma sp.]
DVTVLHDDAFVISNENASSVALEPSYFDKVQDYPTSSDDNKYLLSIQNVGATLDEEGLVVPVTEDLRNGNGRAIKSIFWTKNRVNKFDNKVDSIFWIMKDNSLPPIIQIKSSILASALGSTLATKRTTAEYGADPNKLVFEPYANPFRLYPLRNDYIKFKDLFENKDVDCYILNTGSFLDKDISKSITLGLIEDIVSNNIKFKNIDGVNDIMFANIENFNPDFANDKFKKLFIQRMQSRVDYINSLHGHDILPEEASQSILNVFSNLL